MKDIHLKQQFSPDEGLLNEECMCRLRNIAMGDYQEVKTEVPRDVRNSKVRKEDKFRRDRYKH